ncbi:uncharacterized protein [Amphiura filiformis]|uniref:uncharacterized protein n=1 Tax=Amphiura filiformis TaxID=82378 RepID=UPI003B2135C9
MELTTFALITFSITTTLLTGIINLATAQTALLFQSSHSGPYANGDTATLVCKVTDYDNSVHIVSITRTQSLTTVTLIYDDALLNSAPDNVEFLGSFPQSDSTWKIIKINDMSTDDAGLFTCSVISRDRATVIVTHTVNVQVQFVPIPQCSLSTTASSQAADTYHVGDILNLVCVSELGVPTAALVWGVSGNGPTLPQSNPVTRTDDIYLQVTITLTSNHDGVSYQCFATSSAGNALSCGLGPYSVLSAVTDMTTQRSSTLATTRTRKPATTISMRQDFTTRSTRQSVLTTAIASTVNISPKAQSTGLDSSAVAAICVFLIIILIAVAVMIFLVKTRRLSNLSSLISRRKNKHNQRQARSGLHDVKETSASPDEEHAYYNAAQDLATVEHVKAPPDGALYAVVNKRNSQENIADLGNRVAPTKHVKAAPNGVLYAVVDKRKSQENLAGLENGTVPNNNHTHVKDQSKNENKFETEPALYANLDEASPAPGTDSPAHRRAKSTTTTAIPCTDDASQDPTTDITPERPSSATTLAVPCSDGTDNSKDTYATVNKGDSNVSNDQPESPSKDLNVEGLLYADLELCRPSRKTDTIISTDEATIYADIGDIKNTSVA